MHCKVIHSQVPFLITATLEILDSRPLLKELKKREFRWPVLADALGADVQWDEKRFDFLQTLAQIRSQYSKSVLLRLYVSPDDKNSQQYVIKVRLRHLDHNNIVKSLDTLET